MRSNCASASDSSSSEAKRAGPEGGRWLVPTLSGMAVADGLAAAFDLSLPN